MKTATAKEDNARVSLKNSQILCKILKGKKVSKAKKLLEDLIESKRSLKGKYYTKTSKKFLEILKTAEANAKHKDIDTEKLWIKNATANRGRAFILPKSRYGMRGREAKAASIEITVEER
jgi:ribosomal protein L22